MYGSATATTAQDICWATLQSERPSTHFYRFKCGQTLRAEEGRVTPNSFCPFDSHCSSPLVPCFMASIVDACASRRLVRLLWVAPLPPASRARASVLSHQASSSRSCASMHSHAVLPVGFASPFCSTALDSRRLVPNTVFGWWVGLHNSLSHYSSSRLQPPVR